MSLIPSYLGRAERFGTNFIDPVKTERGKHGDLSIEAKRERLRALAAKRDVFVTGLDPFSQVYPSFSMSVSMPHPNKSVLNFLVNGPDHQLTLICFQEEMDKRRERADRFNIEDKPLFEYKPDEEIEILAKRAQKFDLDYEPAAAVLMDMGEKSFRMVQQKC